MIRAACLSLSAALLATSGANAAIGDAPAPAWSVAACQMVSICTGPNRCLDMALPGRTYLYRNSAGDLVSYAADTPATMPLFPDLPAAAAALQAGDILGARREFFVEEAASGAEGAAGVIRISQYRLLDSETGVGIGAQHMRMVCEAQS